MAKISVAGINYNAFITEEEAYYYRAGKQVLLTKSAGTSDTIEGGNGSDYIEAGAGNDIITGGNGKDTIYGGAGNDQINGDSAKILDADEANAKDVIYGGSGQDTILGGNGADVLYGDGKDYGTDLTNTGRTSWITAVDSAAAETLITYKDTIYGGNGGDTIIGGLGGDTLSGQSGPDVFVYESIADSRAASYNQGEAAWQASTGDLITDFIKGQDQLDFTTLNVKNDDLYFSDSGQAANAIWGVKSTDLSAKYTILYADTDGDGKADMAIKLNGWIDFSKSDFIGLNDAPVITSNGGGATAELSIDENQTHVTNVSATDPDFADVLTYSIVGGADEALFTIDSSTGALSFKNTPDRENPIDSNVDNVYDVTVRVSDGTAFDEQAIQVTVTDVDDNDPVFGAADYPATVAESISDATVIATVAATDADITAANNTIAYSITGGDPGGLFEVNSAGQVSLAAGKSLDAETTTSHVLEVTASDGSGTVDTATVSITVTDVDEGPVNHPPAATADKWIISNGAHLTILPNWLLANDTDVDGDSPLAVTAVNGLPSWMTANFTNDVLTSISVNNAGAGPGSETNFSFSYTLSDGKGGTTTGSVNIELVPIDSGSGSDTVNLSSKGSYDFAYIDANNGEDTLTAGSGTDRLIGGGGNDTIKITAPTTDTVDGGGESSNDLKGTNLGDILVFDGFLDLTAISQTSIVGIETISMKDSDSGSGDKGVDSLVLNVQDVLDLGSGTFNPFGSDLGTLEAVRVMGDSGDSLTLSGGGWNTGVTSGDKFGDAVPSGYTLYVHDGSTAEGIQADAYLLVQNSITVNNP